MKKVVLMSIVLPAITGICHAQQPQASTKAKPQPTRASEASKRNAVPSTKVVEKAESYAPFSLDMLAAGRIPLDYKPAPLAKVIEAAEKVATIKKGEFESSADFDKRLSTAATGKLMGELRVSDLLAISSPVRRWGGWKGVLYQYDADAGKVSLYADPYKTTYNYMGGVTSTMVTGWELTDWWIEVSSQAGRSYNAKNSFGASTTVQEITATTLALASLTPPFLKASKGIGLPPEPLATLPMDSARAAQELPNLKSLLLFKLQAPFMVYHLEYRKPTLQNPEDLKMLRKSLYGELVGVVIYSGITGDILGTLPSGLATATPDSGAQ